MHAKRLMPSLNWWEKCLPTEGKCELAVGFCAYSWQTLKQWTLRYNKTLKTMVESGSGRFCHKKVSILIRFGPAVSFTLGWIGDVPGIIQYMIWFEEQTKTTYFLILWVFTISTQPSFLKNCSLDPLRGLPPPAANVSLRELFSWLLPIPLWFLVSFVENACQLKIFKTVYRHLRLKIPGGLGT